MKETHTELACPELVSWVSVFKSKHSLQETKPTKHKPKSNLTTTQGTQIKELLFSAIPAG
jgi:hypothetical protein